jgi:hypothetical protein
MQEQIFWSPLSRFLQRWRLRGAAALLLESSGAFNLLMAQIAIFSFPFLTNFIPEEHFSAFTNMLEHPGECQRFAAYLREEVTI